MNHPIRMAVVGIGKIARDQHLPAIAASTQFELAATVSPQDKGVDTVPHFSDFEALSTSDVELDAVAVCTPPQVRRQLAASAIARGWHVLLEKPPAATLAEVFTLRDAAADSGVSLFASWHARFAAGVEPARNWLAGREVKSVQIIWRENVRVWHPGQDWIWQPGGFGVFDPGINALSIATRILPRPFFVTEAALFVPENRAAPIAARASFQDTAGIPIELDLDFREEGPPSWDIIVATDAGTLTLSREGSQLSIDGVEELPDQREQHLDYPGLYQRFAEIVHAGASDVDVVPFCLVADIFMIARVTHVEPYIE